MAAEPFDAAILCQFVHDGRVFACVDRPAHQRHRQRRIGVVRRFHAGDRREHRHRRLAHRDHVGVAAQRMQHRDDVIDVVVEIEPAVGERHHARIDPFGDVDVVIGQERVDRAAQQRRVMAGHRRDDQQLRLRPLRRVLERALEMQQPTERPLPFGHDVHWGALAAHQGGVDAPVGLAVAARGALEEFERRGCGLAGGGVGERIGRILVEDAARIREGARRRQRRMAHFVEPVHRRRKERTTVAGQRSCPAELTDWHVVWPRPDFLHCSKVSRFRHLVNPGRPLMVSLVGKLALN
jgi:hypothetical protein